MPIHLPPISRRRFLGGTLAAGAGLILPDQSLADDKPLDPNRFALLADTHIDAKPDREARGVNLTDHFIGVRRDVLGQPQLPAALMISGDCAYNSGQAGDYAQVVKLVGPYREAGVPVHVALGNHDHRQRFLAALPDGIDPEKRPVADRHISIIETPHANWFLLDSLKKTLFTPGRLGMAQLRWLAKALDARADKPALLMAHHYPTVGGLDNGLLDSDAMFRLLADRKQVKAYFFGHSHRWQLANRDGIHLINLPAVAYVFDKSQPSGWVDINLYPDGASLTLHSLDTKHPKHGKITELKWRV